ncbi:MAG: ATP-dependent RecD-like DNA helicase [Cyanobium sp.]
MSGSGREREQPAWLRPLQDALVEALPRLYGLAPDSALREHTASLLAALERGELSQVLSPAEAASLAASPYSHAPDGPLVVESTSVSWRRWHSLRQDVIAALIERAGPPESAAALPPPPSAIAPRLDTNQRQAVQAVLEHRLVLLQGGPGTGKTSTVGAMIAAVLEREPACRVHLAAPTGKAAARLRAATAGHYPCSTLHRLLESRGERFGRNRRHPLALDLLVLDEVSMVNQELMAALLEALPAEARLVLVGDPAQLPPIEPGAVLLDLQQPNLRQSLGTAAVNLTTSYRNAGAIAQVAGELRNDIVMAGSTDARALLLPLLRGLPPNANLASLEAPAERPPRWVLHRLRERLTVLGAAAAACRPGRPEGSEELLDLREQLLVLAPLRGGPWGVDTLHRALLTDTFAQPAAWPEGLPVLCTRNLPEFGLANGDVGVMVGTPGTADRQLLFGHGETLWIDPAPLRAALEPGLALTVHKAQGSEAAEVIVLLPEAAADPRLLYTALTRARERATLLLPAASGEPCSPQST